MKNLYESGKIYFFKTGLSENTSNNFGSLLEVNSNFDILKSLHIGGGKALGITSNNELLEWEFDSKQNNKNSSIPNPLASINSIKQKTTKKNDFYFLLFKPSYHFHKIKFSSITLNKTMCLGLDTNGNVLVWGQNQEGLLGLGYDVTLVETPTILNKLKDIKDISLSDYHAVVLNNNGNAFSWGLGKYGELGLERSIYTPTPQQILTDTAYSKVFCGNLITCLLDGNGHFYYFGVVIKQLGGYSSTITLKSLLNDQSYQDGKNIYFEKEIEELETENFKNIVIGNGFVALLSKNGLLYVLEYNNKLTMLYSKFFLYNITVAYNEIYGLARERPKIEKNKDFKDNYYLCRWNSKSSSENDLYSDIWSTTMWKFKEDFQLISNCKLLQSNNNKSILLLKDQDKKYNLHNSIFNPHRKNLDMSMNNNDTSLLDNSVNINNLNNSVLGDMMINQSKKILPEKFLEYNGEFDDSYNIKYKKCKIKINIKTGIDSSSSYLNINKTHFFKTSQNNNNIINKINNSMTPLGDPNNSANNNLFSGSYNIQFDLGKENDNVNIYRPEDEEMMNIKEKELKKYRNEVDNIINNFKLKRDSNNATVNSFNKSKNDVLFNEKNKKNNNIIKNNVSQNSSNQNERYSLNNQNSNDDNDYENNIIDINSDNYGKKGKNKVKFQLTKEGIVNSELNKKKKRKENDNNYNNSLSRVRKNIISLKDKMKFKDKALNKLSSYFNLSEDDIIEETEKENNTETIENEKGNNKNKNLRKKKKIKRSSSYSNFKINKNKNKTNGINGEGGEIEDSDEFVDYEDLNVNKRERYNSVDNNLLNIKNKDNNNSNYEEEEYENDSGDRYNENNKGNFEKNHNKNKFKNDNKKGKRENTKNKEIDFNDENTVESIEYTDENKNKLRGANKSKKNKNNQNEFDEEYDNQNQNELNKKKISTKNRKGKDKNNNNDYNNEKESDEEELEINDDINKGTNNKKLKTTNKKQNNNYNINENENNDDSDNNIKNSENDNIKLANKKKLLKNKRKNKNNNQSNNNNENSEESENVDENNFNNNNKNINFSKNNNNEDIEYDKNGFQKKNRKNKNNYNIGKEERNNDDYNNEEEDENEDVNVEIDINKKKNMKNTKKNNNNIQSQDESIDENIIDEKNRNNIKINNKNNIKNKKTNDDENEIENNSNEIENDIYKSNNKNNKKKKKNQTIILKISIKLKKKNIKMKIWTMMKI